MESYIETMIWKVVAFGIIMACLFCIVMGTLWLFCPNFYNYVLNPSTPLFPSLAVGAYSVFSIIVSISLIPLIIMVFLFTVVCVLRIIGVIIQTIFYIMF